MFFLHPNLVGLARHRCGKNAIVRTKTSYAPPREVGYIAFCSTQRGIRNTTLGSMENNRKKGLVRGRPETIGIRRDGTAFTCPERVEPGRNKVYVMGPDYVFVVVILLVVRQFAPAGEPIGVLGHVGVVPILLGAPPISVSIIAHLPISGSQTSLTT